MYLTARMAFDVLLYTVAAIHSRFDWLTYRYLDLTPCADWAMLRWIVISRGKRNIWSTHRHRPVIDLLVAPIYPETLQEHICKASQRRSQYWLSYARRPELDITLLTPNRSDRSRVHTSTLCGGNRRHWSIRICCDRRVSSEKYSHWKIVAGKWQVS
jgi:hypothetical protein